MSILGTGDAPGAYVVAMTVGAEISTWDASGCDTSGCDTSVSADLRQAEYFWQMFDRRKVEICELLETQLDELEKARRNGSHARARIHRRVIKALEAELGTVDRMLFALRSKLGLPTARRTS
jgi:hypothetical protein